MYKVFIGATFIIVGVLIFLFGTAFYKLSCSIGFFVLFLYFFVWDLSLVTFSFFVGFLIAALIGATLAFIVYSMYDRIGSWVGTLTVFAVLFALLFILIAQLIWAAGKWTKNVSVFILLIGCIGFFVGLLVGYLVEKDHITMESEDINRRLSYQEKKDLRPRWIVRHILMAVLGSYLLLRGVVFAFFDDYYPNDFLATQDDKNCSIKIKSPIFLIVFLVVLALLALSSFFLQRCITAPLRRQCLGGKKDQYVQVFEGIEEDEERER